MKKHYLFTTQLFFIAFLISIFISCSNYSQNRNSASFEIKTSLLQNAVNRSVSVLKNETYKGDSEIEFREIYLEVKVSLIGDYTETQIQKIYESEFEKTESLSFTFTNIPENSVVGAEVEAYTHMIYTVDDESYDESYLSLRGTSEKTVRIAGSTNELSVKLIPQDVQIIYDLHVYFQQKSDDGEYEYVEDKDLSQSFTLTESETEKFSATLTEIISEAYANGYILNEEKSLTYDEALIKFNEPVLIELYFDINEQPLESFDFIIKFYFEDENSADKDYYGYAYNSSYDRTGSAAGWEDFYSQLEKYKSLDFEDYVYNDEKYEGSFDEDGVYVYRIFFDRQPVEPDLLEYKVEVYVQDDDGTSAEPSYTMKYSEYFEAEGVADEDVWTYIRESGEAYVKELDLSGYECASDKIIMDSETGRPIFMIYYNKTVIEEKEYNYHVYYAKQIAGTTYNETTEAKNQSEIFEQGSEVTSGTWTESEAATEYAKLLSGIASVSMEGYEYCGYSQSVDINLNWNIIFYFKLSAIEPTYYTVSIEYSDPQTVQEGKYVSRPEKAPAREHYTFGGWYSDKACTVEYDFASPVTSDITIYAKWTPVTYTITYVLDGGNNSKENPATYTVEDAAITLQDPQKEGYYFEGWYVIDSETQEHVSSPTIYTEWGGDRTLYAIWQIKSFKVTFINSITGNIFDEQDVDYQGKVTVPESVEIEGYTFNGWYSDKALTKEFGFDTLVESELTIYGKWTAKSDSGVEVNFPEESVTGEVTFSLMTGDTAIQNDGNGYYSVTNGDVVTITADFDSDSSGEYIINWIVNGTDVDGVTGTEFNFDTSDYSGYTYIICSVYDAKTQKILFTGNLYVAVIK